MVKLIIGIKGTGKTKTLIKMVDEALEKTTGDVVVLEKGEKLRFDIKYQARLVNTDEYYINDAQSLYGFVAGILASNHDVTDLFIDTTLRICANDVAAFTNTDLSDAANRMTAALRGEGEAAEALGFSINQTTLEEYARQQGIEKSIAKMSQAELVNLRYGLMVQQAGDMVGYATSEQGSFTAQLARAKGVFTDLAATMGTYLLPIITEVITKINEIMAANFE